MTDKGIRKHSWSAILGSVGSVFSDEAFSAAARDVSGASKLSHPYPALRRDAEDFKRTVPTEAVGSKGMDPRACIDAQRTAAAEEKVRRNALELRSALRGSYPGDAPLPSSMLRGAYPVDVSDARGSCRSSSTVSSRRPQATMQQRYDEALISMQRDSS